MQNNICDDYIYNVPNTKLSLCVDVNMNNPRNYDGVVINISQLEQEICYFKDGLWYFVKDNKECDILNYPKYGTMAFPIKCSKVPTPIFFFKTGTGWNVI